MSDKLSAKNNNWKVLHEQFLRYRRFSIDIWRQILALDFEQVNSDCLQGRISLKNLTEPTRKLCMNRDEERGIIELLK